MSSRDGDSSVGDETSLSLDAVLDALGHYQRRKLLRLFREESTRTADFERCVNHLLEVERRRTGEVPSLEHLRITLHHVHLPKLSETGVLTYGESAETVRYHPDDTVERWLDVVDSERDSEE